MAKFRGGDLRLKDLQKVTFGDNQDFDLWWDGSEFRVNSTVSGVEPVQNYHLTTKSYVDDAVSGLVTDHGDLTGLGDDDHTQYHNDARGDARYYTQAQVTTISGILQADIDSNTSNLSSHTSTSNIHFTEASIDHTNIQNIGTNTHSQIDTHIGTSNIHFTEASIDHGSISGLGDDDHTQYILVDGTRAFTSTVGGVTPTSDNHLATKFYVDNLLQGLQWQEPVINIVPVASGIASEGNRYIASETGGGWTEDYIYEYIGATWSGTAPYEGMSAWVEELDALYVYNGTDWVRFGTTVTHNILSGLQGGTTNEYYHMTSAQYTALTDSGGVNDAGSYHHHDGRYYTETELNNGQLDSRYYTETELNNGQLDNRYYTESEVDTISGSLQSSLDSHTGTSNIHFTEASIDHTNIQNIGTNTHSQIDTHISTSNIHFTEASIDHTNISNVGTNTHSQIDTHIGDSTIHFTEASIDHGSISGLNDDDHTQYILVDGSRGFTNTVSGVAPTQSYHLATKAYVDSGNTDRHGRQAIGNGSSTVTVNFSDLGHTNYTVNATMENTSDSPPSIYAFIVSARTSSSFTVTFMGEMDSANYSLNWTIIED